MFDCQYLMYVTNFKAFYILLNILNDAPWDILSYFNFYLYLIDIKIIICLKWNFELTKFMCSAHKLAIEEGRYRNIDRNDRICVHCNMGIVEYHFLMVCPYYRQIRTNCLPAYYCRRPSLHKFKILLKTENGSLFKKKIAKYICIAMQRRNEVDNELLI